MNSLLLIPCLLFSLFITAQNKADLIIVNGKVATMMKAGEFKQAVAIKDLNVAAPPVIPEWSPVKYYGGYQK
jgi:hypothetical protein